MGLGDLGAVPEDPGAGAGVPEAGWDVRLRWGQVEIKGSDPEVRALGLESRGLRLAEGVVSRIQG